MVACQLSELAGWDKGSGAWSGEVDGGLGEDACGI